MSNNSHNSMLTPELRSWIDNVVAPALARQYLAERQPEKGLAPEGEPLVESASTRTAIAEEGR